MNDRELLELAARAAYYHYDADTETLHKQKYHGWQHKWNPLESNEDAFTLAVDLQLSVTCHHDEASVLYVSPEDCHYFDEPYGQDGYAATRRAITRAAASIGAAK